MAANLTIAVNSAPGIELGKGKSPSFLPNLIVVRMFFVTHASRTRPSQPHSGSLGRHRVPNQNDPTRGPLDSRQAGRSTRSQAGGAASVLTWSGSLPLHHSGRWISDDASVHGFPPRQVSGCTTAQLGRDHQLRPGFTFSYGHRTMNARLPVRSAIFKHRIAGSVLQWVTMRESPVL
jgi:hypothetical protein